MVGASVRKFANRFFDFMHDLRLSGCYFALQSE
jgi:hypothetical protein